MVKIPLLSSNNDKDAEAPKTRGEKFYDGLQFFMGKAAIMAITAAIGYVAKYGKDNYRFSPNYLKRFQEWMNKKLLTNKVLPLQEHGELGQRLAGATANTMLLFHGGNAFAPAMLVLENNHENIANYVNRHCGTPEEVEIAHERLKDKPKQNWNDIIKGRMAAWALIFSSFMAADTFIGKDKKTGLHYFDRYEEWFGRKLAGLSKTGKDIAHVPVGTALTAAQDANKVYRFGKILALDIYATSAAIIVWNFVSRLSAEKRQCKNEPKAAYEEKDAAQEKPADAATDTHTRYTKTIRPRVKPLVHAPAGLHAKQVAMERHASENTHALV